MSRLAEKLLALHEEERGSVILLVALSLTALLGFVALVLDVGIMYETRHQLQTGVGGAALAGAWELPDDPVAAVIKAREYAGYNGISDAEITSMRVSSTFNGNDTLEVRAERAVNLIFAPILGIYTATVEARDTAIVAQIKPKSMWPLCLRASDRGQGYAVFKMGPPGQEGATGSFKTLDFPPPGGAEDYQKGLQYGWDDESGLMPPYHPPDSYSWWVDPQPGNKVGETSDAIDYLLTMSASSDPPSCLLADPYNYDPDNPPAGFKPHGECYRIGYLSLVSDASWEAAQGNSNPVEITGFAPFYIISYNHAPHGQIEIHGVFLQNAKDIGKAIIGAPLEGLIGARLWH